MMPSTKAILLAAAIAATSRAASLPRDDVSSLEIDAGGDTVEVHAVGAGSDGLSSLGGLSPVQFLETNPPELVLSASFPSAELHGLFDEWRADFGRAYDSLREGALRKLIWLDNHSRIEAHNSGRAASGAGHELGHNDFSDMTNDEFRKRFYLGEYSPGVRKSKGISDGSWISSQGRKLLRSGEDEGEDMDEDEKTVENVPDAKDWKEEGAVTKVKNQWLCGCCWAMSAIGAIEGARYIKTGNLTDLSIQQLIDCDLTDSGCSGGLMDQAFGYDDTDSPGLCSMEEYPFAYHRHWFFGCRRYMPYCTPLPHTRVKKFVDVKGTEEALRAAVATQPVSVAVNAGGYDWQFYKRGIFKGKDSSSDSYGFGGPKNCTDEIDHGVLAVGYGHYDPTSDPYAKSSDEAGDFWLIKNSWGSGWGLDGYMQVSRGGEDEPEGGSSCIYTMASRPLMREED